MQKTRNIYVSTKLIQEAVASKEVMEALALVLAIKATFVNSTVKNASFCSVKHFAHIGYERAKRIVTYAVNRGWLVWEGKNLRATSVKDPNGFCAKLKINRDAVAGVNRDVDGKAQCPYTLTRITHFIREMMLFCHISKQMAVFDTLKLAARPGKHTSQAAHRKAKKRVQSWGMRKAKFDRKADRLSYQRIGEVLHVSRRTAIKHVKELTLGGVLCKHENYKKSKLSPKEFFGELDKIDDRNALLRNRNFEREDAAGYLVYRTAEQCGQTEGGLYIRFANSYAFNTPNLVKYVYTPNQN